MTEHKELIRTILVTLILGIFWWVGYVAPKQKTLRAATDCFQDQGHVLGAQTPQTREVWNVCLLKAEDEHASKLLLALGY